jgi:formylglycine-generating enzyme required for sulfatase activity
LDMQEIRLERFDPARIYQFLHLYLGDDEIAVELFQQLQARPGLLDLFSLPYSLMMLVEIAKVSGRDLPRSRAALFTRVVRNALVREIKKNNPHFTDLLLTRRGRDTLQDERFIRRHPYYLADHPLEDAGRLVPALGTLARHMQAGASAEGTGRRLSEAEARSAMQLVLPNKEAQTNALQLGADASILDMDELALPALWFFRHHQLQEYFAGRNLVRRFSAGESVDAQALWTVRWLASDLEPLDPSTLGRGQRYPHVPDSTAWEETTILAAGLLAQDPGHIAALIRAVLPHNPVLAARCLLELQMRPNRCEWPSFSPQLEAVAQETRQVLLSRLTNPEADRRARLGAGFALGDLGDPRFTVRHTGAGVRFIAPQWLAIPDGTLLMGSPDSPFDYERPVHPQTMVGFSLATHPVTVAEYACFVAAGGYRDPQWWESADAQAWRRGELTDLGESWVRSMQAMREQLRPLGEAYVVEWAREQLEDFGRQKEHVEILKNAALLDDAAFAAYQEEVRRRYNIPDEQQREQPAFWAEGDLANPSQPVVGVSWYEAQAYCAWLGHCLGMKVRLPTEAEWEYAARGPYGWKYPWGDRFDLDRANVKEGCIRRPTPVGAFPAGASYWGVNDMGGNVWEWTSSVWGSDSSRPTTGKYPYIAGDDREDINAPPIAYRVLRGDSFRIEALGARCAARNWFNPYRQYNDVGFRVATSVR